MVAATALEDRASSQAVEVLFGAGLPTRAEEYLRLASLSYERDEVALGHLRQAEAIAPGHAAVLIGLYRFYFYKGRLAECLEIAHLCLAKASRENDIDSDWRKVQSGDAEFGSYDAVMPRFYCFVLKGYAYLQMRLGNIEEGHAAVLKLLELDPSDKVGAIVLLEVYQRMGQDDED
jgi:tetratricopeptide (TPR) repeat protein